MGSKVRGDMGFMGVWYQKVPERGCGVMPHGWPGLHGHINGVIISLFYLRSQRS